MPKPKLLFFLTLFLLALFFKCFPIIFDIDGTSDNADNTRTATTNIPLILFYTPLSKSRLTIGKVASFAENCKYRCSVSENQKLYPESDIAIFNSRYMQMSDFLQQYRSENRLNIFYTIEAFPYEKIRKKKFPKDFFNITMTFRRDSTLWRPYDKFERILPHESKDENLVWTENQINFAIIKKQKLAVQFVSHCHTHSSREKLTEDIKKFTNISTYGSCYDATNINESEEIEQHFFYFAFENSVCKDYITEKFWRIKQLIVPVVMKRSILKGIVEDEYFIAADDFNSTQALVDRLIYLSKNVTEYKKYLRWTWKYKKNQLYKYKITQSFNENDMCDFCEMAVKQKKYSIPDIYQWWENESECQINYINYTKIKVK